MALRRVLSRPLPVKQIANQTQQVRWLSLHEYQAHNLLRVYQLPVPRGKVAETADQAESIAEELGGTCVLKAQIFRGGRRKGRFDNGLQGGIQFAKSPREAKQLASKMLGHQFKTTQTLESGLPVKHLLVTESLPYEEEWYIALTIDRETYSPMILLSKKGGVDIERLAEQDASELFTYPFKMSSGITSDLIDRISREMQITPDTSSNLGEVLKGLFRIWKDKDATLLEVNPLVRASDGKLTCLEAKFTFDDAAQKRQPEIFSLRDKDHEIQEEVEAEKYGLIYVRMEGNIGNVVNGAGLAMATNDAIHLYGGSSANFLDAGGQATKETMQQAFKIVLMDDRVKAIIVNVYGGITRCDMIAESIIGAAAELGPFPVPVVVRLQGTNSQKGLQLLQEANLGLHVEADFGRAAQRVVELANGA